MVYHLKLMRSTLRDGGRGKKPVCETRDSSTDKSDEDESVPISDEQEPMSDPDMDDEQWKILKQQLKAYHQESSSEKGTFVPTTKPGTSIQPHSNYEAGNYKPEAGNTGEKSMSTTIVADDSDVTLAPDSYDSDYDAGLTVIIT